MPPMVSACASSSSPPTSAPATTCPHELLAGRAARRAAPRPVVVDAIEDGRRHPEGRDPDRRRDGAAPPAVGVRGAVLLPRRLRADTRRRSGGPERGSAARSCGACRRAPARRDRVDLPGATEILGRMRGDRRRSPCPSWRRSPTSPRCSFWAHRGHRRAPDHPRRSRAREVAQIAGTRHPIVHARGMVRDRRSSTRRPRAAARARARAPRRGDAARAGLRRRLGRRAPRGGRGRGAARGRDRRSACAGPTTSCGRGWSAAAIPACARSASPTADGGVDGRRGRAGPLDRRPDDARGAAVRHARRSPTAGATATSGSTTAPTSAFGLAHVATTPSASSRSCSRGSCARTPAPGRPAYAAAALRRRRGARARWPALGEQVTGGEHGQAQRRDDDPDRRHRASDSPRPRRTAPARAAPGTTISATRIAGGHARRRQRPACAAMSSARARDASNAVSAPQPTIAAMSPVLKPSDTSLVVSPVATKPAAAPSAADTPARCRMPRPERQPASGTITTSSATEGPTWRVLVLRRRPASAAPTAADDHRRRRELEPRRTRLVQHDRAGDEQQRPARRPASAARRSAVRATSAASCSGQPSVASAVATSQRRRRRAGEQVPERASAAPAHLSACRPPRRRSSTAAPAASATPASAHASGR